MRGSVARDFRRQANEVAQKVHGNLIPPIKAAFENEQQTRKRVDDLEKRFAGLAACNVGLESRVYRGFWGRLRWLLTGE
jgi:hypothetical protein